MKKTIIVSLALFVTAVFNYASGRSNNNLFPAGDPDHITTLVINADVNVILVDNDIAPIQMMGDNSLTKFVILTRTGGTLVISSSRNRNLKGRGFIYVSANWLKKIQINREADVRSLYPLQIPKLDVVINAACKFNIANFGKVNLTGTESYSFEQTIDVQNHPANIFPKKISSDQVTFPNKW